MRNYFFGFVLLVAASPAFAQAGATQSPPSPNAASASPTPAGSVPPGASNVAPGASPNVSGPLGSTTTTTGPTTTTSPGAAMSGTVPTPAVK